MGSALGRARLHRRRIADRRTGRLSIRRRSDRQATAAVRQKSILMPGVQRMADLPHESWRDTGQRCHGVASGRSTTKGHSAVRAVVKRFEWDTGSDVHDQLIGLVLHVGPIDGPGEEMFFVNVCTPAALAGLLARDGLLVGRHYLFVEHVNVGRIEDFINDRLRRLDGDTWTQLASKVARIGHWEFEK